MSTNRRINLTVSCPAEVPYAWNITSDIYCSDMTMRIDRNMTINESANVFFDNITLIMNSSSGAHNGIWSFGNLTVNNSNVTAGNPDDDYFWWNEQPGKLVLENSDVTEVNYDRGVYFNTYSALVIRGNGSSIKNNQIVIDSEARQYGITFLEVSGCQFENNTLISTGASAIGVWAYNSSYINLDHNTLSVTGSVGYGFYLNYAIGINFTNNTISTEEYPGFSIGDSSDVSFFGNTIVSSNSSAFWFNSQTGDVSHFNYSFDTYNVINGATIYYFEELSGTTIENIENIGEIYIANSDSIVVRNITFADNAGGLYLLNTHNSLVTELRFPKSKGYTLNQRFAQNNTFTDISVNNTGKYGISFNSKYSNNTKVMNLTLINSFRSIYNSQYGNDNIAYINSSFTSTNAACIYMTSLGEEQITNTFTNTNVSCTYSGKGIVYLDQEIELYFTDTIIHNSLGPAIEFNTPNSNNSSLHFVNATFNESGIIYDAGITANYTVAWYMDVHVNDTDGNPLYGVIVTARNRTGQIAAVGHTDQDGRARLNLTNYKSNLTDRFYQNNYTINYTFGNFNGGWSVNMSTNRDKRSSLNLTLPFIGNFSLDNRTSTFLNKTKEQLMNYSNLTLARPFGLIRWIGNTNTNGARLAQHIMMASKLIAVNTSALNNTFDSSANLEITGVDCSDYAIYRSSAFHNSAASVIAEGTECPSNICTAVSCNGTTLSFTVSGFSSYAVGPVLAEETPDTPATVTPSGSTSSGFAKNMESITFNDVKAGQEKIFILSNYLIAITKVSLKAKEFISKMKISVRSYEEAPYSLLESTIDGAYQYLKVSHENYFDNSQVEDIRFEFKVPKSWLGADKAMLYRYNDGDWNKQRTESTSTDTSYVYYTGYPEGLSYFAIAKEEAKVVPVKETPKATEPTAQTPEPILQSPQPTAQTPTGQAINPTQHTTKPTPHTQQEKSWFASNITMLVSVSVVLIGLIIAGIVFIIGHRKYPHPILQSPQPTPQDSRLGTQSPHPTPHTPESHTSQPDQKAMVNSLIRRAFEGKPVPESVQNIINATKAWAQEQSQKGHTKEQIKAALLKQGWQEDLIDRLLG
ncbi:hypothetical protein COV93_05440 [Candidatus Woesearchaeota archaeon CG11_big_fil_rev_8_21_14_0_20_43_8]|nr:MAG: hypothetical protein COV93_05440 [Candidatus Woesearchaeota archaeon CG11_big_fil_rev_8_21_14_0_20_43_8]